MKKYVCSLENAKRLAELGVERDSYFCYTETTDGDYSVCHADTYMRYKGSIRAYSVGELGEMLPKRYVQVKDDNGATSISLDNGTCAFIDMSEADARAKVPIWRIENGHVKAEDLNG